MGKIVTLFKKPAVLIGSLVSLFLASTIVIVALFMGQEAGNFVIEVEGGNERKSVQICEKLGGSTASRLEAPSITEMTNTTYHRFSDKLSSYQEVEGFMVDEDQHVYVYSFYMINEGSESLRVRATMYYSNVTNNLDKAIRVLTMSSTSNQKNCYQVADETEMDYGDKYPAVSLFLGDGRVYEEDFLSVDPGATIKYTVVLWLEGNDPDCTDAIRLGQIRFALKLAV